MAKKAIRNFTGSVLSRELGSPIRYRFSSDRVDRHRSIIDQDGLSTKNWNRSVFWGHDISGGLFGPAPDPNNVVGKAVGSIIRKAFSRPDGSKGKGTEGNVQFAQEVPQAERARLVEGLIRGGYLPDGSLSFRALEAPTEEDRDGQRVTIFGKTEMLEFSVVPVASNQDAQALIRSMYEAMNREEDLDGDGWKYEPESNSWTLRLEAGPDAGSRIVVPPSWLLDSLSDRLVPSNVSTRKAPEEESWSKPSLGDFTDKEWGKLSSTERRRIMGHFAWAPSASPATFSELKLPHHRASDGYVVWAGVRAAMSRLNQAATDIPSGDRSSVHSHLAAHYKQFDKEVPPLRDVPPPEGADYGTIPAAIADEVRDWVTKNQVRRIVREVLSR